MCAEILHSSAARKSQAPNHKTALPPHTFKVKSQRPPTFSSHLFSVLHAVDQNTPTSAERWSNGAKAQRILEAISARYVGIQSQNSERDSKVNIQMSLQLMGILAREDDASSSHNISNWVSQSLSEMMNLCLAFMLLQPSTRGPPT